MALCYKDPYNYIGSSRITSLSQDPSLCHVCKVPFDIEGDVLTGSGDQDVDIIGGDSIHQSEGGRRTYFWRSLTGAGNRSQGAPDHTEDHIPRCSHGPRTNSVYHFPKVFILLEQTDFSRGLISMNVKAVLSQS